MFRLEKTEQWKVVEGWGSGGGIGLNWYSQITQTTSTSSSATSLVPWHSIQWKLMQGDKGSESSTSTLPSGYIKITIENGPFMIFLIIYG